MADDFAFNPMTALRESHVKEVKRRGIKAEGRDELNPEVAMATYGKDGSMLHSFMSKDKKVSHMHMKKGEW